MADKIRTVSGRHRQAGRQYTLVPGTTDTYAEQAYGGPNSADQVIDGKRYASLPPTQVRPTGSVDPTSLNPAPVLGTLMVSSLNFVAGAAAGTKIGDITGKTAGSTITFVPTNGADAGKVTVNGAGTQLQVGSTAAAAGNIAGNLVETLAGATGSPKSTPITVVATSAAPVVVGLAMTQQTANTTFQRSTMTGGTGGKGQGTIRQPISLTAAASLIEYRLRDAETAGNPVLQNWTTAGSNVAQNAAYVDCPNVPAAAKWYFLDLRANGDDAQIVLGTNRVQMGRIIAFGGQSQAVRHFGLMAPATQTADQLGFTFDSHGATKLRYTDSARATLATADWRMPAVGSVVDSPFIARFLSLEVAKYGVGCAMVGHAVGGTAIADWAPGSQNLTDLHAVLDSVNGFEAFHWHQGGTDATSGTLPANYRSGTDAVLDTFQAHNAALGAAFKLVLTSMWTRVNGGTASTVINLRRQMRESAAARGAIYLEPHDVELGDDIHQTSRGNIFAAENLTRAFSAANSNDLGPRISGGTRAFGSKDIVLPVTQAPGATAISLLGNPADRFKVYAAGSLSTTYDLDAATPLQVSASQITIRLAADPGNVPLDFYAFEIFDPSGATADENLIIDDYAGDAVGRGRSLLATPVPISIAQPSAPGITVYASDIFTDTNGVVLASHNGGNGITWSVPTGGIEIRGNRARPTAATALALDTAKAPPSADYAVEADFYFLTYTGAETQGPSVVGRAVDATNYYDLAYSVSAGGWALRKTVAGAQTILASGAMPVTPVAAASTKFRLEMVGSTLKAVIGGTVVATVTDTTYTAEGSGGLRNSGATPSTSAGIHWDNFQLTSAS